MYTKQTLESDLASGLIAVEFSSKNIKTDDFTGEIGNPYIQIIPGSLANYESGAEILHLKKNEWLFNVASMKYILLNRVIPLKYIPTFTKYMNIKRTNGDTQSALFDDNCGLQIRDNDTDFYIRVFFTMDKMGGDINRFSCVEKTVKLSEIMKLNNLNVITIKYPSIKFVENAKQNIRKSYDESFIIELVKIRRESLEFMDEVCNNFNKRYDKDGLKINVQLV